MFFALSKILNLLLTPITWFIFLFISILFIPQRFKKWVLIASTISLYLYCTDLIINPLLKIWEYPLVWYKDIPDDFDAVIVLGGMSAPGKKPDDRTHFPGSPDRLLHAFQLYKLGKTKNILISGGSGDLLGKRIPEAQYLVNVLMLCDMDTSHLWFESKSKNTRENALFTKELLEKKVGKEAKLLLVTSAFHMRRSVACYEKAGLNVTPFSVDAKIDKEISFWFSLVPNPNAPGKWQVLIHEVMGYLTYKIVGYI